MNEILKTFKKQETLYRDFMLKIELLVKELLTNNDIKYHKLESRLKTLSRLDEKIKRKNNKYNKLSDVTDIIGLRLITFFEDEVDKIASVLDNEFIKDPINSIDKRVVDDDRFGYQSLHYVVELSKERKRLTEYKRFKNLKVEIQIRSILQHAWAEIEHDIGYKAEISIPSHFRRNFSRVSALLEIADLEFVKIKEEIEKYDKKITKEIIKNPSIVEINLNSIVSYVTNNNLVTKIDKEIINASNFKYDEENNIADSIINGLHFIGIKTIEDLNTKLNDNKKKVVSFAKNWLGSKGSGKFTKGISIFYLLYVLVGRTQDIKIAQKYVFNNILPNESTKTNQLAQKIIDTYKKMD